MKGLKKVALVSAIAAISAGAQAELKALDDTLMGEMTGQAGLTIDVETKWTLGEFMYKDGGSLVIQNMALGGNVNETAAVDNIQDNYLDNIRLTIDIAGAGNGLTTANATFGDNWLAWGFSDLRGMAAVMKAAGNADAKIEAIAGGVDTSRQGLDGTDLKVDAPRPFANGDLVIHSSFTDAWQKGGGFTAYANNLGGDGAGVTTGHMLKDLTFDETQNIVSRAVDFSFGFEVLGLASSTYQPGSAITTGVASTRGLASRTFGSSYDSNGLDDTPTTTTLISNLTINGYFGPSDMVIQNRGNGFATLGTGGGYAYGDANSQIVTQRYINITDLDVYIDIAGVQIRDMKINNTRGDLSGLDGTSSFGFAHGSRTISAVKDNVLDLARNRAQTGGAGFVALGAAQDLTTSIRSNYYSDGIKLHNKFKGDIDIGHLSFGSTGTSIGQLYFTDYAVDSKLTISAH